MIFSVDKAYICKKPRGSCSTCEHNRFDDDYGSRCCWAAYDIKNKTNAGTEPGNDTTEEKNEQI